MNPRTRVIITEFWEFLAFFVNSIVFLLIGDQIRLASLAEKLDSIAVTSAAVIVTRAIAIYSLGSLSNWLVKSEINWREQRGGVGEWGRSFSEDGEWGRLLCSVFVFNGDQSRDSDSASCYAWHSSVNLATSHS